MKKHCKKEIQWLKRSLNPALSIEAGEYSQTVVLSKGVMSCLKHAEIGLSLLIKLNS